MYRIHKLEEKVHSQDLLIGTLQQEKQKLEDRINKAIEYIEKETIYNDYNEVYRGLLDGRNANELLRILNGKSDE